MEIRATCYVYKRKNLNWEDLWNVEVRGEEMVSRFFSEIGPKNPKHIRKFNNCLNSRQKSL
ncbi:MAG: hypothetical protein Q8Q35_02470 [Nanoarchaeota archaeon]|nr:hypothetical protein [Nanoarchaeota archaeon]